MISTITTTVAGTSFRADEDPGFSTLRPTGEVKLVVDPDNEHDKRAIKVMWGDKHLGYVPKKRNESNINAQDFAHECLKGGYEAEIEEYSYAEKGEGDKLIFNDEHKGQLMAIKIKITAKEPVKTELEEGKDYRIIEDKAYPRVTKITGQLTNWDAIPQDLLKKASERGTAAHNAIEEMAKTGKWTELEGLKLKECVEKITEFMKSESFIGGEWRTSGIVEVPIQYDGGNRFVGKADFVSLNSIIDWKTSKSVAKHKEDYFIQLSAYATALKKGTMIIADLHTGELFISNEVEKYFE